MYGKAYFPQQNNNENVLENVLRLSIIYWHNLKYFVQTFFFCPWILKKKISKKKNWFFIKSNQQKIPIKQNMHAHCT